ncbi:MAG: 23S rRNA (uracil(1939)-C(5))-methyltransferase RlmD [Planctomycetes bacterium]|nr:23S rRNA (uracil(1939)-C(5))-methyltransferase RlmD [Planctomycetota bacterium]
MESIVSCQWFPACSGCSAIGRSYGEQLATKLEQVRRLFAKARLPAFDADQITKIHPSGQISGYRNRVRLVPAYKSPRSETNRDSPSFAVGATTKGDGIALGLYREDSHVVVDIPQCPVHTAEINRVLEDIRSGIESAGLHIYDESTHRGDLRFVTVRQGINTGELLVGLVTRTDSRAGVQEVADHIVSRNAKVEGVLQNVNPRPGNVVFGAKTTLLTGRDYLEELVCDVHIRLGLRSFFQVNTSVAAQAYRAIQDGLMLSAEDVLIDLYCGVGSIGLTTARHVSKVIGIEEVGEAVHFAIDSARANDIRHAEFQVGKVEDRLPRVVKHLQREGVSSARISLAVNPPRKGIHRRCVDVILETQPSRIAYLSCSPVTLVRDTKLLAAGGYRLQRVELFDMFPQTDQVETLVVLERTHEASDAPVLRRREGGRRPGRR